MNGIETILGDAASASAVKTSFLKWQCLVRQIMMREKNGRPDDGIIPALTLAGETAPLGHIITILLKSDAFSVTPELLHMYRKTQDPAQRREQALHFFSATYYQRHQEFSDVLTATFPAGSPGAEKICDAGRCLLVFDGYGRRFELHCDVRRLSGSEAAFQATLAHNQLFNATLPGDVDVLGFTPDWLRSHETGG